MTSIPYENMSSKRASPLFKKWRCCLRLRVGCFMLGYLSLIANTYHIIAIVCLATYLGINFHDVDHYSNQTLEIFANFLNGITILFEIFLMLLLCVNLAWLVINIATLVGLHKKRPGPIKVYVACAIVHLLLVFAFLFVAISDNTPIIYIVSHSLDFGLSASFIVMYSIYAIKMKRENKESHTHNPPEEVDSDVYDIDSKLEKPIIVK